MNKVIELMNTDIELIDGDRGSNYPSKDEFSNEGYCLFLDASNITEKGFDFSSTQFITKDKDEKLRKGKLKRNDIVMMTRGSVGNVALYDESVKYDNIRINSGMIIIRCHYDYDAVFLYYMLKCNFIKKQINDIMSGSVQKQLPVSLIKSLILFKEDEVKKYLLTIIRKIDKIISNNNQINAELELMTKTIYDYWFLQFEFPNEEGKPYKSSGGKMVWNEELGREIPEGWEVDSIINNRMVSVIKPGVSYFDNKNYLATANVTGNNITDGNWVTYENRESRANMQPILNSIWFARMKNSIKHITLTDTCQWFVDKYILSTGFVGLKCNEISLEYMHCFINSDRFEYVKDMLSHGATQEAVNNDDLKAIKLIIPSDNYLKKFSEQVNSLIQLESKNIIENQQLSSLRDFLLPLLMNGQVGFKENINVKDIEVGKEEILT